MNKRVLILIGAVITFFLGAIWVSEVPAIAPLVAFLEMCAGFAYGFFFSKTPATSVIETPKKEDTVKEEKKVVKAAPKKTAKSTKK